MQSFRCLRLLVAVAGTMHQRCAWLHYVTGLLQLQAYLSNKWLFDKCINFDIKSIDLVRALYGRSSVQVADRARAGDDLLRACHALVTHRAYKGGVLPTLAAQSQPSTHDGKRFLPDGRQQPFFQPQHP